MSWIESAQRKYILGRTSYESLSTDYNLASKTLQKYITKTPLITGELPQFAPGTHFACVIDATYFSTRSDGLALIRTNTQYNLNSRFISSESKESMNLLMNDFTNSGYDAHIESFTVDGKKLMIKILERRYPTIPIQMCLFHMKAIIRRYTTMKPKTKLGKALLILKACLGLVNEKMFIRLFEHIETLYADFLAEENIQGEYEHR